MRPRYVINKGIQKRWTAKGSMFVVGNAYTAALYNPKDKSIKIESTATCVAPTTEGDEKNIVPFVWSSAQTALLKEGYATIEIHDANLSLMAYRDQIAIIRKNSLQIAESASAS